MSHRRTHLWISLIVGVFVWGAYFAHFIQVMRDGDTGYLLVCFIAALIVIVLAEVVVTGMIAWLFRRRARVLDEGPTLDAALRASHVALMALISMTLITAGVLAAASALGWEPGWNERNIPVIAANALLAMVVIAELVRAAFTLALMPRS